jgi:hypothetical protein
LQNRFVGFAAADDAGVHRDALPLPPKREDDHRLRAGCEFLLLDLFHPVVERGKLVDALSTKKKESSKKREFRN